MLEILVLLPTGGAKRGSRTTDAEEIGIEESGMAMTAESRKSGAGGARKREFSGRNKGDRGMRVRKSDGGTPGRVEGMKDVGEIKSERRRKRRLRERDAPDSTSDWRLSVVVGTPFGGRNASQLSQEPQASGCRARNAHRFSSSSLSFCLFSQLS